MGDNIKKIIINEPQQSKTKIINFEKEIKLRVETKTWGLNDEELAHQKQLNNIMCDEFIVNEDKDKYKSKLSSHIKNKLYNYKQQDIIKKKLNEDQFVSYEETIQLLRMCSLKCCYGHWIELITILVIIVVM